MHRAAGPLFLVFHDSHQDIKYVTTVLLGQPSLIVTRYLRSEAVQALPNFDYLLPDQVPDSGIYVVDTADLFAALEGDASGNRRALERVCRHLQIDTKFLHNAGNDAHVSLCSPIPATLSF